MYLAAGRKLWTFYPPENAGGLGPLFADSMDPVFRPGQLASIPSYTLGMLPRFMFANQRGNFIFFPNNMKTLSEEIGSFLLIEYRYR
jgi:hypothetical protein